jgi:hypothetical protein
MATWEDGPEYAPIERPDEFSTPDAAPLGTTEPYVQPSANAPLQRPAFGGPQAPVIALADLVPAPEVRRDPTVPYEVVSSAVTSGDSAWTAMHSQTPTSPIATTASPWTGGSVGTMPVGTPSLGAWPSGPLTTSARPTQGPTGLPAPGTTQWFAPPPYAPPQPTLPITGKDLVNAVTPALLIVLALGGLIHPVSPITLIIAWALSTRATVAKQEIRIAFVVAVAVLAVLGLFIGLAGALDFSEWWSGLSWIALVLSWGMIVAVLLLARRAFQAGQGPPVRRNTWG